MKQLSNHQVTKLRNLFHGQGTRDLFTETIESLKKMNFDVRTIYTEVGEFEGDICNTLGCKGTLLKIDQDGGCSCHISAPCGYCCVNPELECDTCDYHRPLEYC